MWFGKVFFALILWFLHPSHTYTIVQRTRAFFSPTGRASQSNDDNEPPAEPKALAFLRKKGRVGGAILQPCLGVDEGTAGGVKRPTTIRKSKLAYQLCTKSGIIDDMSEEFPISSSGNRWKGVSDKNGVVGNSFGSLTRELQFNGRSNVNVLRGEVFERGFAQAILTLPLSPDPGWVDASMFAGITLDICSNIDEKYFLVIKNGDCNRSSSSYRYEISTAGNRGWHSYFAPFDKFSGVGPDIQNTPLNPRTLVRFAVAAIGRRYANLEVGFSDVVFTNHT